MALTATIRSRCRRAVTRARGRALARGGAAVPRGRRARREPGRGRPLEALAILDRIGAVPLARRVRAELRGRGARSIPRGPSTPTRRNPAGLTDRQVEVLRLLAEGLTNAEIADRLVVSVRTVDTHVAAILTKLGVSSRQEAARLSADLLSG